MKKQIDKFLDKMNKRKMSWIILAIAYVLILNVICMILVTQTSYQPWEFEYRNSGAVTGYKDFGEKGIFSFGPYVDMDTGNWKVTIEYETTKDTTFDVVCNDPTNAVRALGNGTLPADEKKVSMIINVDEKIDESFEVRTYYPGEGAFRLKSVKVGRCFVFKWYLLVTLGTVIASIVMFQGKRFFKMIEEPKHTLYFTAFYFPLLVISVLSMAYFPEQDGEGLFIGLNLLAILHGYGMRQKVYERLTRKRVSLILGCTYIMGSLYVLDLLMRGLVVADTGMDYSSYEANLFTFAFIGVMMIILSLIPKAWIKRVVFGVTYYFFVLLYGVHRIYYEVFGKLFSFKDMRLAKEGSDYADYVMEFFDVKFARTMLLLIIAGVIGILLIKETLRLKRAGYLVVVSVIASILLYNHTLYGGNYGEWNSFENDNYVYATMTNRVKAFELCGFFQYELRDLQLSLFSRGRKQKELIEEVDRFYEAKGEAKDNELTGLLEGRNVVFVLMESIDDIALNETVMPTLHQMSKSGIYLSNMYASIYGSAATFNSEMVTNVGLYAPVDGSLVYSFAENHFPYSLATRFSNQGYAARQYHFNTPSYYSREYMNKTFGYSEYVCYMDYASGDYAMDTILTEKEKLFHTLVQDEKFFDYVITYSAHLSYDDSNSVVQNSKANHPEFDSLTPSAEINNYLAKCRVTDDMFRGLLTNLRDEGKLDNTVIIAIGDHYPYGIKDENTLYELSGVEKYQQLLYKVPCIIWSQDMQYNGMAREWDKVCSSIDLVPTIANLFNLGDKSVYVGRDVFDEDYAGFAYFADGSWITREAFYRDGQLVSGDMSEEEIEKMNELVMDQITANDNILHSDYYRESDYHRDSD